MSSVALPAAQPASIAITAVTLIDGTSAPRRAFLKKLVQTYGRRKADALFSAFKRNRTWHVPTLVALGGVWDARRAQLEAEDAAALDSATKKSVEISPTCGGLASRCWPGATCPFRQASRRSTTNWSRWCAPA